MSDDKQFLDSLTDEERTAFAEMQAEANEPAPAEPPVEPDTPEPEEEPVAAKEEPKAEPEGDKPPKGMVPHGALHSEREARKEAERKAAESEAAKKALEERIAALEAAQQPKPEPVREEPWPDPITDVDAYNARVQQELQKRDQALGNVQQDMRRQAAITTLAAQAQRAKAELPDYDAAIGYAIENYKQELAYMNPGVPESQIMDKINRDVEAIAFNALSNGRDAAKALYEIARLRGYRGQEPQPTHAAPGPSEAEKVAALARAQENTSGFANASPSAGGGELTLARLSAMSDAEFARVQRENPDAVRRAMGA